MEIWLKARKEQSCKREAVRLETLNRLNKALTELKKRFEWDDIYIFGSVNKTYRFQKSSDIDIGIAGLKSNDLYRFAAELSSMMDRNVDIVRLEESRMADEIRRKGAQWPNLAQ